MKEYELTVLVHPDLELDLEKPLTKIRDIITGNGGEILKESNWGKKRLAYAIKKEDFAIYVNFEVKLPAQGLAKLSSVLNITDEVLRYLTVGIDAKTKAKIAEANKRRDDNQNSEEEK